MNLEIKFSRIAPGGDEEAGQAYHSYEMWKMYEWNAWWKNFRSNDQLVKKAFSQMTFRSNDYMVKKAFGQMTFQFNDHMVKKLSVKWPSGGKRAFGQMIFRSNDHVQK